ncbi:FMN reductase [Streptomyces sp. NBS 14/10]|uniref:FMN reductase n=1 Tax=Streptomyces sp. NBS 14/10 TaxID=1945643 RepID=UPI00211AD487|nr:FMN reductase [Streptomyces sp. NBS 14/10]KAK1184693.1 FMN reductase [Streptomyces sp. NBS 14/10]
MNDVVRIPQQAGAPRPVRLAVVSAGLSVPSSTRLLADRLAEATRQRLAADGHEVEVHVVELRDLAGDIANNMVAGFPSGALEEAIETVTGADGLIAVTPVFSASYSGLFKSFFDVIDNTALAGKPVLAAATGGTARHSLALEHALRPLFAYLRAIVLPTAVYAASEDWGGSGDPLTDTLPTRIDRAAGELADLVGGRRGAAAPEAEAETVVPFEQQLAALRSE